MVFVTDFCNCRVAYVTGKKTIRYLLKVMIELQKDHCSWLTTKVNCWFKYIDSLETDSEIIVCVFSRKSNSTDSFAH